ncbi:MAG: TniQ family protein [Spirochaetales bacterium]|nr:TniQ family protein [Spirochaetales bacterium]
MADIITVRSPFMTGNMPNYHTDELMYSYLMRVAVSNGFESIDEFLKYTVCADTDTHKFYKRTYIGFDCMKRESDCLEFENEFNWLISGTIFKGIAPLQTREDSQNRLREYYNNSLMKTTPGHVEKAITSLRLCPECMWEEGDDWYYHTGHQMPYVSHCSKHGCRLLRVNPLMRNIIKVPDLCEPDVHPMERYLSDFSNSLFEYDLKCCGNDLLKILKSKIGKTPGNYNFALKHNHEKKYLLSQINAASVRNLMVNDVPPSVSQFILLLAYYFDDAAEIEKHLTAKVIRKTTFMEAVKGRFKLLGEYRPDAVHVRCLHCGAVFFISPWAVVNNGTLCYECAS